jgi:ankyrin repeat protein
MPLLSLPNEVLYHIFFYLPPDSLEKVNETCQHLHTLTNQQLSSERLVLFARYENEPITYLPKLLKQGARINYRSYPKGLTALHTIAGDYNVAKLHLVLENGASVNCRDYKGRTALHYAAKTRSLDNLKILIAAGAEVNARDEDGNSPLHIAARHDQFSAAKHLLASVSDPNSRNIRGETPLHLAASAQMLEILLSSGAEVNARTTKGATPLDCLVPWGYSMVGWILQSPPARNMWEVLLGAGGVH